MKKDIFNGKIKQEHAGAVLFSILLGAAAFLICAVVSLCLASHYQNAEQNVGVAMYVVSAICFACFVGYPLLTVLCVRSYPKCKRLAHFLLKKYVFIDLPDENDKNDDATADSVEAASDNVTQNNPK